jgi:hypothetical protein
VLLASLTVLGCAEVPEPIEEAVPLRDGCAECRIEATHLVSLGDEQAGHLGYPQSVVQNADGQFLVASRVRPWEILIFGPDGAFARTIGQRGEGPGEFEWIAWMSRGGEDTLHVIDMLRHRWTVLSPGQEVLRTAEYRGEFNHQLAVFANGSAAFSSFVAASANTGDQIHLTGPDGQILRSFGGEGGKPVQYDLPSGWARILAVASDSTVWAAPLNDYRIALWHTDGRKLLEFARQPLPFTPWIEVRPPSRDEPPQTIVRALRQDAEGRLWLLYHVADQRWRDGVYEMRTPEGVSTDSDRNALLDTVVEVIDPEQGTVLASLRVEEALHGFAADGVAYSFSETEVRIQIWALRLIFP